MRIIGLLSVLFFSLGIGVYLSENEKRKCNICEEMCGILEALASGILKRIPANAVICRYCEEKRTLYLNCKNKEELLECLGSVTDTGACGKAVSLFGGYLLKLGKNTNAKEEYDLCIEALGSIRKLRDICRAEYDKKHTLYAKLGLVCGMIVCIAVL